MGPALAVAVAVDVDLVRCLLVSATMTLFGDANWWAPALRCGGCMTATGCTRSALPGSRRPTEDAFPVDAAFGSVGDNATSPAKHLTARQRDRASSRAPSGLLDSLHAGRTVHRERPRGSVHPGSGRIAGGRGDRGRRAVRRRQVRA